MPICRACSPSELEARGQGQQGGPGGPAGQACDLLRLPRRALLNDEVVAAVAAAGFASAVTSRPAGGGLRPIRCDIRRSFVEDFSDATFRAAIRGGLTALGPLDEIKRLARRYGSRPMKAVFLLTQDRGGPVDLTVSLARELSCRTGGPQVTVVGPASIVRCHRAGGPAGAGTRPVEDGPAWLSGRLVRYWRSWPPTSCTPRIARAWRRAPHGPGKGPGPSSTFHGVPDNAAGRWVRARPAARPAPGRVREQPTCSPMRWSRAGSAAPWPLVGPWPPSCTGNCGCRRAAIAVVRNGVADPAAPPAGDRHPDVHHRRFRSRRARQRRFW